MSARAAWRLERLGFTQVYDYTAGKVDWLAAGLPTHGTNATRPRAKDALIDDVATCHLTDRLGDVARRAQESPFDTCVVVNDAGIVQGRLRKQRLDGPPDVTVEEAMELGPTTVRADEPLHELRDRMTRRQVNQVLVTTPEGRLLGIVTRDPPIG